MTQMMAEVAVACVTGIGAYLLISSMDGGRAPSLARRLAPYHPGAPGGSSMPSRLYGRLRVGLRVTSAIPELAEPLSTRLARVHDDTDPSRFRLRQVALGGAGALAGLAVVIVLDPPPLVAIFLLLAPGLVGWLIEEQRLARRNRQWQRRLAQELPSLAETLACLLDSGYSVNAALARVAARGRGACGPDLKRVMNRVLQGAALTDALAEWGEVSGLSGVKRLVGILSLHADSGDLGRLVSEEARQARKELQRATAELMERRAQQVWVPVTVAALVPGAILLAVPFVSALRGFASA